MQSRQAWTNSIFQKYRPDPIQQPKRSNHSRKKWPCMRPLGVCTLTIGPHTFHETTFYEAMRTEVIEEPVVSPAPLPQSSTGEPDSVNPTHPLETSATTTLANISVVPTTEQGGANPITAVTTLTNMSVVPTGDQARATQIPDAEEKTSEAQPMEIVPNSPQPPHQVTVATEQSLTEEQQRTETPHPATQALTPAPSTESSSTPMNDQAAAEIAAVQTVFVTPWAIETAAQDPVAGQAILPLPLTAFNDMMTGERRVIEHYDVVFEFQENSSERFIFPKDAIVEATNMAAPFEILASFHLPAADAASHSFFKDQAHQHHTRKSHQATTVRVSGVSPEVLAALRRAVNDVTTVYGGMIEKMRHLPNRVYMQYQLPADLPSGLIEEMGVKALLAPPTPSANGPSKYEKRRSEAGIDNRNAKRSRMMIGIDDEVQRRYSGKLSTPRSTSRTGLGLAAAAAVSPLAVKSDDGALKKCAYCGSRSTPMWRRGPGGAGTLCNACGVKWKHGKILQGAAFDGLGSMAMLPNTPTPTSAKAKTKRHSVSGVIANGGSSVAKGKRRMSEGEDSEAALSGGKRSSHVNEAGPPMASVDTAHLLLLQRQEYARVVAAQLHAEGVHNVDALGGNKSTGTLERGSGNNASGSGKGVASPLKKRFSAKAVDQGNQMVYPAGALNLASVMPANVAASIAATLSIVGEAGQSSATIATIGSARPHSRIPVSIPNQYYPSNSRSSPATPSPITPIMSGVNVPPNFASVRPMASAPTPTTASGQRPPLHTFLPTAPAYQQPAPAAASVTTATHTAAPTSRLMSSAPAPTAASASVSSNSAASSGIPLPTLSIAFGPHNAYFTHPNCGVTLFDDHFEIKLQKEGHQRTNIEVWKESVESSEFEILREGADGREVLLMRATVAQYMTRFDSELLNPERSETAVVFRFLEKLDPNGGAVVRRILERWLGLQQHGYGLGHQAPSTSHQSPQQQQASPQGQVAHRHGQR
ncbi:hypothetical protein BC938DRAFT_470578 [Jimgerdemannia flammicorona]|uniref:GATA-type domain-containing protein n=1 Tax=Jimgerdemannia flammicorona TaxID=994334 RepID=A0A433QVC4_9FUNG|nr:hypothetical protein BC938DRAFT_470578 [Jimgerdemannia flammicorona]